MKSAPVRNPDKKGYFDYPLHIRLLYIDIFPPSDILIINTVGIEGSGSHQADPCDFLIAGVDFFVRQSYLERRKAVFHLYHDSPPLIPYRRRSLFFAPFFPEWYRSRKLRNSDVYSKTPSLDKAGAFTCFVGLKNLQKYVCKRAPHSVQGSPMPESGRMRITRHSDFSYPGGSMYA